LDDATFKAIEASFEQLPIVNEAALKAVAIPYNEDQRPGQEGIVGNSNTAVQDPKNKVDTEGLWQECFAPMVHYPTNFEHTL